MINLTEQQVRLIVKDEINRETYQGGVPKVYPHTHDGNNSTKINAIDIIPNKKFTGFLEATAPGGIAIITNGIYNPTSVLFYGIARNPTSGTATYKSVINGNAQLGECFQVVATNSARISTNVIQLNTSTFFDNSGGSWVPTVNADPTYLVSVYATNGSLIAYIYVSSWSNTSITLTASVPSGWLIEGNIIIT